MEQLNPLLDNHIIDAVTRSKQIAAIFKGLPKERFIQVARDIPLIPGAVETVVGLRKAGYLVGIVTDSYRLAAETVRKRVFADFSISHVMRFSGDKSTGKITLAPAMIHSNGCRDHRLCKLNVLRHLQDEAGIRSDNLIAVGDSDNDVCLLRAAGTSIAFQPKSDSVQQAAKHIIQGDLRGVLRLLGLPVSREDEIRASTV